MKRLSLILVILILALSLALSSCSDPVCQHRDADDDSLCDKCGEDYTDGKDIDLEGFEFTLKSDGTYEVSDYEGDSSSVTVPGVMILVTSRRTKPFAVLGSSTCSQSAAVLPARISFAR